MSPLMLDWQFAKRKSLNLSEAVSADNRVTAADLVIFLQDQGKIRFGTGLREGFSVGHCQYTCHCGAAGDGCRS
jgi:hypothetical protein